MITVDGVLMASAEIQKGEHLVPEVEEGNREYKFKLTDLSDDQLTHRITQLNWRLNEGNDEAFYLIGVEDNGNQLGLSEEDLQESLKNLQFIAHQVGCEMMVRQLYAGEQGTTAEVYMRRKERMTVDVVQVNVAVAGDLNSGKSTMIGVLSTGQLDNGKGLARTKVLTHNHEVETGRTSCISHHSLHFSGDGEVLNSDPLPGANRAKRIRALSDLELADETNRTVVLMDLAGHAKYLKTTLHGLIGRRPDHCIVCVSATTGLNSITTEHLGVCMYLNVPLVIVITKVDCVAHYSKVSASKAKALANKKVNAYVKDPEIGSRDVNSTISAAGASVGVSSDPIGRLVESIQKVLSGLQRTAQMVRTDAELVQLLQQTAEVGSITAEKVVVPVFCVSNVSGDGLQLLRSYLFQLPTHAKSRLALQQQSTCVRILGSIGNTEEREDVVYPRDEDIFSVKREVRHSTNRCTLSGLSMSNVNNNNGSNQSANQEELVVSRSGEKSCCLQRCGSNSEDNLTFRSELLDPPSTPHTAAAMKRPYSSPDLPAIVEKLKSKVNSNPSACTEREFYDLIEYSTGAGSDRASQYASATSTCSRSRPTSPAAMRTKVLIGSIDSGKISVGEPMLFGPNSYGEFVSVTVTSLRLSNVPVRCASAGQTVTFKLSECMQTFTNTSDVNVLPNLLPGQRRSSATGLVLLSAPTLADPSIVPENLSTSAHSSTTIAAQAHWEFEAEVLVLNHPSKIRINYEPVVHVGCVKQSAKLISVRKINSSATVGSTGSTGSTSSTCSVGSEISTDEIGNGERAVCRFRFLYYPEFIIRGEAMIIREQRTRGVGTITLLL